jgi:23S rRNA (adenine1618-N6)-methyltransferase
MCNPPFFESLEEGGLNPKTSCGGTSEEMVCSGGEKAFITRIIEDSTALKQSFRYPFFYMDWIAFLFLMCKC